MATFPVETRNLPVGIRVAVYLHPSAGPLKMSTEIQRAPDDSGAPDEPNAVSVGVLPPNAVVFTDIPGGAGPWWYRARHVRPGATESSWTRWLGPLSPEQLPPTLPPLPPLGVFHQNTSDRTITGATASGGEDALDTFTIPGAMLTKGDVEFVFSLTSEAIFDTGAAFRVRLNGSLLATVTLPAVTTYNFRIEVDITYDRTADEQSVLVSTSKIQGSTTIAQHDRATLTEDVDAEMELEVTIDWQSFNASDTATLHRSIGKFVARTP